MIGTDAERTLQRKIPVSNTASGTQTVRHMQRMAVLGLLVSSKIPASYRTFASGLGIFMLRFRGPGFDASGTWSPPPDPYAASRSTAPALPNAAYPTSVSAASVSLGMLAQSPVLQKPAQPAAANATAARARALLQDGGGAGGSLGLGGSGEDHVANFQSAVFYMLAGLAAAGLLHLALHWVLVVWKKKVKRLCGTMAVPNFELTIFYSSFVATVVAGGRILVGAPKLWSALAAFYLALICCLVLAISWFMLRRIRGDHLVIFDLNPSFFSALLAPRKHAENTKYRNFFARAIFFVNDAIERVQVALERGEWRVNAEGHGVRAEHFEDGFAGIFSEYVDSLYMFLFGSIDMAKSIVVAICVGVFTVNADASGQIDESQLHRSAVSQLSILVALESITLAMHVLIRPYISRWVGFLETMLTVQNFASLCVLLYAETQPNASLDVGKVLLAIAMIGTVVLFIDQILSNLFMIPTIVGHVQKVPMYVRRMRRSASAVRTKLHFYRDMRLLGTRRLLGRMAPVVRESPDAKPLTWGDVEIALDLVVALQASEHATTYVEHDKANAGRIVLTRRDELSLWDGLVLRSVSSRCSTSTSDTPLNVFHPSAATVDWSSWLAAQCLEGVLQALRDAPAPPAKPRPKPEERRRACVVRLLPPALHEDGLDLRPFAADIAHGMGRAATAVLAASEGVPAAHILGDTPATAVEADLAGRIAEAAAERGLLLLAVDCELDRERGAGGHGRPTKAAAPAESAQEWGASGRVRWGRLNSKGPASNSKPGHVIPWKQIATVVP